MAQQRIDSVPNMQFFDDPQKDATFKRFLEQMLRRVTGDISSTVITVLDDEFTLQDDGDATKQGQFDLANVSAGATRILAFPNAAGTIARLEDKLSAFAATTSAELAGVISNETGSGLLVFGTNPVLTTPDINGGTADSLTSLSVRSTGSAFDLTFATAEVLAAGRTLSWVMGDAARTITLSGNPTLADWFDQSVKVAASPTFVGLTLSGDLAVDGGDFTSSATTFNLLNATVTTVNFVSAATSIRIGAAAANYGFGNAASGQFKYNFSGSITSSGAGTSAIGLANSIDLTGAAGDTAFLAIIGTTGQSIVTQGNTDTIAVVATVRLTEPAITVGTGDTVTLASTLHIVSAPTEGTTNAAFSIAAGNALLGGNVRIGSNVTPTVALDVTGDTALTGDLAVNGGDMTSTATTFNLLNATVTTLNLASAGTTFRFGATSANYGFSAAASTLFKYNFGGSITSSGAGNSSIGAAISLDLTGASGDTSFLSLFGNSGATITTQAVAEAVGVVSSLRFAEPNITLGAGSSVTLASTLHIVGAPTEGVTNAAVSVAAGDALLAGNVRIGSLVAPTAALDVTGSALISTNLGVTGVTGLGIASSSTAALVVAAGTTGLASLRVPHGAAPSSPVNGDIWTTTAGLFVRINGVTKTVTLT